MNRRCKLAFLVFVFAGALNFAGAQTNNTNRIADHNDIQWLMYTGNFKFSPTIGLHTEYQLRRTENFAHLQQHLLRTGLTYSPHKNVQFIAGYAYIKTSPYGDFPSPATFPEHRIYEQVIIKNPVGKVQLSHRFTAEQRFVGRIAEAENVDYVYINRIRYRLRAEVPVTKNKDGRNYFSLAFADEVFVGFGENVGENVFDQNRIALLINYTVSPALKFEAGYINQTLQQGKKVNDKHVFQYNNGFLIATHLAFDLYKKPGN